MYVLFIIRINRNIHNYIFDMSDPKYPIAEFNDTYWDEIRNPQLEECSSKIEEICREYGLRDIEFKIVIDYVESALFTSIDFLEEDDNEEEELD